MSEIVRTALRSSAVAFTPSGIAPPLTPPPGLPAPYVGDIENFYDCADRCLQEWYDCFEEDTSTKASSPDGGASEEASSTDGDAEVVVPAAVAEMPVAVAVAMGPAELAAAATATGLAAARVPLQDWVTWSQLAPDLDAVAAMIGKLERLGRTAEAEALVKLTVESMAKTRTKKLDGVNPTAAVVQIDTTGSPMTAKYLDKSAQQEPAADTGEPTTVCGAEGGASGTTVRPQRRVPRRYFTWSRWQ
jgi:hypothetical protein